jgi:large subunit ribosomal protein L9
LAAQDFHIEKRKVVLAEPIKVIGEHEIPIKLHREVTVNVKVIIKKEE